MNYIKNFIRKDGTLIIEIEYLQNFLKNLEFERFYFDRPFYYSANSIDILFKNVGMQLYDIEKIDVHGGSLRWGRRFKWPDYFFRGSWMLRGSNNTYIADNPADFSQSFDINDITINQNENLFFFSSSGISFTQVITRDSRNHPEFPSNGSKSIWTSTLSGSFLGGNQDYHKHELDFNWFTPLHKKVTIFRT